MVPLGLSIPLVSVDNYINKQILKCLAILYSHSCVVRILLKYYNTKVASISKALKEAESQRKKKGKINLGKNNKVN